MGIDFDLNSLNPEKLGPVENLDDLDLLMMGFHLNSLEDEEEEELDENGDPTVSPFHDMDSIEFHLWMEEEVDKEAMRRLAMKKPDQTKK